MCVEDDGSLTSLTITDKIVGRGAHECCSYVHLHPDISVEHCANGCLQLIFENGARYSLFYASTLSCDVEDSVYSDEFGRTEKNIRVAFRRHGVLPLTLKYSIEHLHEPPGKA